MSIAAPKTSLYGNWPLTPSTRWPGETSLECPHCGGKNITISGDPGPCGTGPGGRWRMGDRGGRDFAKCESCGKKGYHIEVGDPATTRT